MTIQEHSSDDLSTKPPLVRPESRWRANPFEAQNRSIIIVYYRVLFPMVMFTVVILWMILVHPIQPSDCPMDDFCMSPAQLHHTAFTSSDYIVEFPVARLVFIASWSSTLSPPHVRWMYYGDLRLHCSQHADTSIGGGSTWSRPSKSISSHISHPIT